MKKFTRNDLVRKCGFTEEETKKVMKAQRDFPELLENEATKIKSAKNLYLKIGLNKAVWSRWYKANIIENEYFSEKKDWEGFNIMLNGNETVDFTL